VTVSFDLCFLSKQPGKTWRDAIDGIEESAATNAPLSNKEIALWPRLEEGVRQILPESQLFVGDNNRTLSDDKTGIQVTLFPDELTLTIPYWYTGTEAEGMVQLLRQVASIIEDVSGLTAYDPQADAPFLGDGERSATSSFHFADKALNRLVPNKSRWRRFFQN
jgi:hypothetical protein